MRAQRERCDMVVATDLGTPQNSTDGFIALLLGGGDAANRPTVSVQNVEVVSLTVSDVQDMFQWASVIAEYTCTGQQCQISGGGDTVTRIEQFELQCVDGGWTDSFALANDRSTPENPDLTTADLRKDCSICVSPEDAALNSISNPVDSEFHCAGKQYNINELIRLSKPKQGWRSLIPWLYCRLSVFAHILLCAGKKSWVVEPGIGMAILSMNPGTRLGWHIIYTLNDNST